MSTTAQGQAVGNDGIGGSSTRKRPWEELSAEPERPGHISRARTHFDKHIIDHNELRANHSGSIERPLKKGRSTKLQHQAARDHQSMSHVKTHHEYHSSRPINYGPSPVPTMYDPSKPSAPTHTPEGKSYTPVVWRQQSGECDKYGKNQEPLALDVDEMSPAVGWTERPRDYSLLPIGRGSSSQGGSQSSQSPQAPQRPPYFSSQHPQPYLLPIDERLPPPQQQQPAQHYQEPPLQQESTGPSPLSNHQPSQQRSNYQLPSQRRIESSEPPRQQQDWSEYRREDFRERPTPSIAANVEGKGHPAPPISQHPYDQRSVERAQEPASYQPQLQQRQQPDRHEYHHQPPSQQQQQQPEYRPAPRQTSPARFHEPPQDLQRQAQQVPPPQQYQTQTHGHPTQPHPRMTISAVKCQKCDDSGKPLRAFKDQLVEIGTVFSNFGDYQDIHEEYTSRGYEHQEVPGFREFHRIVDLVREASVLTTYMVGVAPVLKRMLKSQKGGDQMRTQQGETEMFQMIREMDERLRELGASTSSSYGSESSRRTAGTSPQYSNMPPPPPPPPQQQQSPVLPQSEHQHSLAEIPINPQSPAPSARSQIEPASTRRSATNNNASLPSQSSTHNPNIPSFAIESFDPSLEAKLTKLKARLEAEISEVDNLTEEKKRLEDRIKELEAMVEEERERRRAEIDIGMKDRTSFLSILEGVVALGRRDGDNLIKREHNSVSSFVGGSDRIDNHFSTSPNGAKEGDNGKEDAFSGKGGAEEQDIEELRKEVEKLRERNRVCESALEHIKRETRHMEETGRKVEESRRGIDLVLGRVLASKEGGLGGSLGLVESVGGAEAIETSAPVLLIEASPVVPVVVRALTSAVDSAAPEKTIIQFKEVVEVK